MKNGAGIALVAIGSAFIGFAAGVKYKKHLESVERNARIAKVKKNMQAQSRKVDEVPTPQETPSGSIFDMPREERDSIDYTQFLDESKNYDKSEDFDRIDVEFPDGDDKDASESDEYDIMGDDTPPIEVVEDMVLKDKKKSYQIEEDEFALNEVDYDQVSWTYYQYDDVVLDFFDMPVDYEDEFIEGAKDVLDKMEDDSSVYWRSPLHRTDVELILCKQPLAETAAGLKETKQKQNAERRKLRDID